jgi:hypothetical protein
MSNNLNAGDLAIVVPGNGPNNVRQKPDIKSPLVKTTKEDSQIPEHAVLAILPRPAGWAGAYPHTDGVHVWWYVRGRTDKKLATDRFAVIEGWTAASKNADPFLMRFEDAIACRDTMGTALDTHLQTGQQAYVLPPDGLNIRKEADPRAPRVGGLEPGTIVTVMGDPECDTKMVWWQVRRIGASNPAGWVSEGNIVEWFLAPSTLE